MEGHLAEKSCADLPVISQENTLKAPIKAGMDREVQVLHMVKASTSRDPESCVGFP
jgi:hypothetical protein